MTKNTTANEPQDAIDPGGTKPAQPGRDKAVGAHERESTPDSDQKVKSGDRNTMKRS